MVQGEIWTFRRVFRHFLSLNGLHARGKETRDLLKNTVKSWCREKSRLGQVQRETTVQAVIAADLKDEANGLKLELMRAQVFDNSNE